MTGARHIRRGVCILIGCVLDNDPDCCRCGAHLYGGEFIEGGKLDSLFRAYWKARGWIRKLGPRNASMTGSRSKKPPPTYPGEGHPWADFLHHRARAIDWLYSGDGQTNCKSDDTMVAKVLSMDPTQVMLIRMRDRSIPNA